MANHELERQVETTNTLLREMIKLLKEIKKELSDFYTEYSAKT